MTEKTDGWDSLPEHLKNDTLIKIHRELALVKSHTRLLVLVSHGFIELLINALVDHHLKKAKKIKSDNRTYSHSVKLLILNEIGLLTDEQYEVFDWFRKLRNRAAHDPIFYVSEQDLKKISDKNYHDPANFYGLCVLLIGGFWNQHVPIFGPIFAPGVTGKTQNADKPK
jgi:uncharacterized protein YutE (UPF0331/DUF86 family)